MGYLQDSIEDEETLASRRKDQISRYKQQMMKEYEEEIQRKNASTQKKNPKFDGQDQQYIPKGLGKQAATANKLSNEEVLKVHSIHKRQKLDVQKTINKADFEINQEDEDDDFAGPKIDLF